MRHLSVAAGLLLALAWSAAALASHEIAISEAQMKSLGITVATVEPVQTLMTERMPARVTIPPEQERVVSAPHGGLITTLRAAVGDEVAAGHALALIESPDLITLQREFLQASTRFRLASADRRRDEQLFREGIIAQRRLLETRSRLEQASAALDERRQALVLAGMRVPAVDNLARTRRLSPVLEVTAPAGGAVLERMVAVGQRVERSQALYRLGQVEPLWLEIRVPLDRARGIAAGVPVEVPCTGARSVVTVIGRDVDPVNQTVLVRAEASGVEGCLRPGQFVQVRLELPTTAVHYRVPSTAVVRSGGRALVFVRAPYGFDAQPVEVGGEQDGYATVRGALKPGDAVAVSGIAALKAAWMGLGSGQ